MRAVVRVWRARHQTEFSDQTQGWNRTRTAGLRQAEDWSQARKVTGEIIIDKFKVLFLISEYLDIISRKISVTNSDTKLAFSSYFGD